MNKGGEVYFPRSSTWCILFDFFLSKLNYRLQLAIEDHHVDFVGHMYCQQTLRRAWYEKLPWKQASTLSKFIHFCIQMAMAPFLAIVIGLKSSIKSAGIRPGSVSFCNE